MMPRLNGIQAVEKVRAFINDWNIEASRKVDHPEIVFLTAYKNTMFDNHMKQLDVKKVFEKPLTLEQLRFIFSDR